MDYFHSVQNFKPQKGDLLISEPYLPDPNFERTVILLCSHDENGSFGFVLNQDAKVTFSDLFEDINHFEEKVHIGGPVQRNTLHFVHRSNDPLIKGHEIAKGIYWGGDFDYLMSKVRSGSIISKDYKFFVGYSGWSSGQLEEELKAKSWFVYRNTSAKTIFDIPIEDLWKSVLKELGGKFKMFSNYPNDPRMN